jgi:nucleoside-diphosphate-sugar epimerase
VVKSILLTGHTGFLGSVIYKQLKKSFEVLTLGRDASCDYRVDFSNWDGSLDLEHSIDVIVHVAGLAHVKSISSKQMWVINADSVDKLISVAEQYSIRDFVFISSVAVYGKSFGFDIDELSKPNPKTVYGKSKFYSENKLSQWGKSGVKGRYINLRLPLIIGKNPPGNLGKLIYSVSKGAHIYLNGNQAKKSVVFASDVARFIFEWIRTDQKKSGTINLCNEEHPTFNWIERTIASSGGYSFKYRIFFKPIWSALSWARMRIGINIPIVGKLFYSLTFSDFTARRHFGYASKPLNQITFLNELNSND